MAVNSFEREQADGQFPDGPEIYSLVKSTKPSVNEVKQQIIADTMPIVVEDTSFPAEDHFHCSVDQDFYSISLKSEDGTCQQCPSLSPFLSVIEVSSSTKNEISLDSRLNYQNSIHMQMRSEEVYSSCIVDIDNENEPLISAEYNEEAPDNSKNDSTVNKAMRRQASLKVGGRIMELLMNLSPYKDKPTNGRVHDLPNNRCRKYKRSSSFSFNSRKVALLFSVLSSLGTLVLIFLTLRVRQRSDGLTTSL